MKEYDRLKRGLKRVMAMTLVMGAGLLPWQAALPQPGAGAEEAVFATPTAKPWLKPQEGIQTQPEETAAKPTQTPDEAAEALGGENEAAEALGEESPEDTALSDSQLDAFLQTAELAEDEKPEDYLTQPEKLVGKREGHFSVLIIGQDSRKKGQNGRSDAMILADLDEETGSIRLVSFLRDMYVKIPGQGMNRLNAAFFYGGAELLKSTLENNFGVAIDRTVTVDFSSMAAIIDQVGGVTLPVSEKERAPLNKLLKDFKGQEGAEPIEKAGEQTLTGLQALCYSRIRKIDSDFQRTSRQHKVLQAIFAKASKQDATSLLGLVTKSWKLIETDMNLKDAAALVPMMMKAKGGSMETMHVPLNGTYQDDVVKGMMVLMPNLKKNAQAIETFLRE